MQKYMHVIQYRKRMLGHMLFLREVGHGIKKKSEELALQAGVF